MTDAVIHDFVAKQRELLELELQATNVQEQDFGSTKQSSGKNSKSNGNSHEDDKEERASHVLSHLESSEVAVGMYGRTVVELSQWSQVAVTNKAAETSSDTNDKKSTSRLLPAHRFTVGDEVEIRARSSSKAISGVISAVTDTFVSVALFQDRKSVSQKNAKSKSGGNNKDAHSSQSQEDEESDLLNMAPLTLVPKSSVEVHKKLLKGLNTLEKYGVDHPTAGPIIRAMFLEEKSSSAAPPSKPRPQKKPQPFDRTLDQSQLEAIEFALQPDSSVALIHGPPGTGKTTTVAELIRQAVCHHGMRVLVTAPSNVAVDNILERLVATDNSSSNPKGGNRRLKTVRLGHPARIKASILNHSLEHLVQSSEGTEIVQDARQELQSFLKVLANPRARGQDKRVAYQQVRTLRKEVRVREEKVVQGLLTSANVVLATTVGAGAGVLAKAANVSNDGTPSGFDLVIIDEAAQALEASCWIPILWGKKVVLAGDHKQLPPTIKSKDRRVVAGLSNTLFERLMKLYEKEPQRISRMLQIQYRMNHNVADWASQAMYNGKLLTHESVRDRTLRQLPSVQQHASAKGAKKLDAEDEETMDTVLLLVDTAGCDMHEMKTAAGSRYNEGEASVVNRHIRELLALGMAQNQIAIITPYNGQVELLRNMILPDFPKVEIRSVDGFQGSEREAVVLSLVRSSERGGVNGIGFLRDDRRQNVAVTRAKRHLAVVCDTETVSKSSFIANLIRWIEEHGEQRSAIEYMSEIRSNKEHTDDLRRAEASLMELVESSFGTDSAKDSKPRDNDSAPQNEKNVENAKRKSLMDKIAAFNESGKHGEDMALSSELTSYDRRVVHEFAEQLALGHRSEGTEGVDRRIILTIQKVQESGGTPVDAAVSASNRITSDDEQSEKEDNSPVASHFAALLLDESDSDEDDNDDEKDSEDATEAVVPGTNSLLAQLAKERAARQEHKLPQKQLSTTKKKKKPKRLGGEKKPSPRKEADNLDGLDDMAFLDAQIEKAQTAHGRKVGGSGKQYKTIVNGILNARPEPKSKTKNTRANAALHAKLKDAESSRKKKNKNK